MFVGDLFLGMGRSSRLVSSGRCILVLHQSQSAEMADKARQIEELERELGQARREVQALLRERDGLLEISNTLRAQLREVGATVSCFPGYRLEDPPRC